MKKKLLIILILSVVTLLALTLAACNWQVYYTIRFDYNGATGGNDVASKKITAGAPVGELPQPTRDGYVFEGWFLSDRKISESTAWVFGSSQLTLVAHWRKGEPVDEVEIVLSASVRVCEVGQSVPLTVATEPSGYESSATVSVAEGDCGYVEENVFHATRVGECTLVASASVNGTEYVSNALTLTVEEAIDEEVTVTLVAAKTYIEYSDNTYVVASVQPSAYENMLKFEITDGEDVAELIGTSATQRSVYPLAEGSVTIVARVGAYVSQPVTVQIFRDDPYANTGASGFYNNYRPATDLEDSYWRTKHNLMSGSIDDQDQEPTLAAERPKQGNLFVRNVDENYADNGNSYNVVDFRGNVVNTVYKCGAYVSLEEVAAYVYAFGDVPANYIASNKTSSNEVKSALNQWGKYLRLNHNKFSGNISRYPFEPVLPNISGCGGSYDYYEIDIGTTGTDCDPSFPIAPYNNGSSIIRGAARIVYARYEGNVLLTPTQRYVFYTYNHYNDFQEYLNYQGGWGEMFGNITGGGTISSEDDYNPTPYVQVSRKSFSEM